MDGSDAREVVWRHAYQSALEIFRRSPLVVRRFVTHSIAPNYSVGAVAACVDGDDRVLLVKSRHQPAWSLPGGLLKRGELPSLAVVRELGEELGVQVSAAELVGPPQVHVDPTARQVTIIYRLSLSDRPVADGVETLEIRWCARTELPTALLRGTRESLQLVGYLAPSPSPPLTS